MSRVAKSPVSLPKGVTVSCQHPELLVKGQKGEMKLQLVDHITVETVDDTLVVKASADDAFTYAMGGTTRALLANMVHGVSEGFEKQLVLKGVGYRAEVKGKVLNLTLGFSHPVTYDVPEGITIETPSQTEVNIKGVDKQKVGQVAAEIRRFRPPEPYKGKGVLYRGEKIKLKEGKKK